MKGYSLRDAKRLATGTRDWREAVWNKWLVGYLTPREDEASGPPPGPPTAGQASARDQDGHAQPTRTPQVPPPDLAQGARTGGGQMTPEPNDSGARAGSAPGPQADPTAHPPGDEALAREWDFPGARRAQAMRSRLDRLLEQMDLLELTVDRIAERQSVAASHDRLQLRTVTDLLDRLVEAQERHTESLISCTKAVERLERRAMLAERSARPPWTVPAEVGRAEARTGYEGGLVETVAPPSMTQRVRRSAEGGRSPVEPSAPLGGKLSDISLPTLLSMAELERWTGRLTLDTETHTVQVDLEGGLLVGVLEDDSPTDAVAALHALLESRDGRFTFCPSTSVVKTELAPITVGSLLLRASHRRDELGRVDAGS